MPVIAGCQANGVEPQRCILGTLLYFRYLAFINRMHQQRVSDIIIVGAGMAGSAAACVLSEMGFSVTLIDRQAECPPCFRAEKIEFDQAELLRKLNLLDARRPLSGPIGEIVEIKSGQLSRVNTVEQYGIRYHDTVNEMRRRAVKNADFRVERVTGISADRDFPAVILQNTETLKARLVILACGYRATLLLRHGARLEYKEDLSSCSFGFDLERQDGLPFEFSGLNYFQDAGKTQLDYITLFRIGEVMRANVFTQMSPADARVKQLIAEPVLELKSMFPGIMHYTGEFVLQGKLEVFTTHFYRNKIPVEPGLVYIGDAYQSVSPTTGTGLSKVLNDVDVLCHHWIPIWFKTRGISAGKLRRFYADKRKQSVDKHSEGVWNWYYRQAHGTAKHVSFLSRMGSWRRRLSGLF